jgi:hypothetical protein
MIIEAIVPDIVEIKTVIDPDRAEVERIIRTVLNTHEGKFSGVGIIVWNEKSGYTCDQQAFESSPIPYELIGDLFKNALLIELAKHRIKREIFTEGLL